MLNVITLFSGYDSQCLALNRLGIPYDLVAWAEIDKHACTAHDALFPQFKGRNVGDVSRVDWAEWHSRHPQPIDLLTYSSPCQDFSSAGLQRGGEEGSGTRSGLLWETERAVRELRPRHLVFENVGGLVSDKFIDLFNRWQARLNGYGYTNFQQLMNAKDYGVPQNRLRIFMVSILDCPRAYYFPKPFPLTRRLKDVLEQNVAERYYLSDERVAKLMQETAIHSDRGNGFAFRPHTPEEIASTVKCSGIGDKTDNFVAEPQSKRQESIKAKVMPNGDIRCYRDIPGKPGVSELQITHPDNESPTVTCEAQIKVIEPQINILGQLSSSQNSRIIGTEGISPAVINGEKDGMPKIVEPTIASMKSRDKDNPTGVRTANNGNFAQRLEPSADQSTSNTITSVAKDNLLIEPSVLTPVRTEYGKAIRKQYGDNNLPESRHNLTQLQPKQDGTSNTLTSVAKDNLLIEPRCQQIGNIHEGESNPQSGRVYSSEGISPTLDCCQGGNREPKITEGIRIRRLTERELYRLMDVSEPDIDTLLAARIPRTQHAKLAGNSIVVACLYHIFRNLFVTTEPEAGTQTTLF